MLANRRIVSERIRMKCEITSMENTKGTMNARAGTLSMPAGSQLFKYGMKPLRRMPTA